MHHMFTLLNTFPLCQGVAQSGTSFWGAYQTYSRKRTCEDAATLPNLINKMRNLKPLLLRLNPCGFQGAELVL